uniref:SGNH hydrolase-type esterase domain-containing protein n=1 Tax=Ditylum brightwellii TaxID=49249 RepID=A0A7S4VUL4_9STRA|mmetsp:Transcript_16316/g.23246  ORF Transcript_16316/g.23246 Transcript_16316/m.23246 type:complete len:455 (+) Transcript_16316:79-1443(+)
MRSNYFQRFATCAFLLLFLLGCGIRSNVFNTVFLRANDNLYFEGRWILNQDQDSAISDWPCSAFRFRVRVGDPSKTTVRLVWYGLRTRILVTVRIDGVSEEKIYSGPSTSLRWWKTSTSISFPSEGDFDVSVHKLTTAAPFGMGIGGDVLKPSKLEIYGVRISGDAIQIPVVNPPPLRFDIIGASDTAGYCVDGTPETSSSSYILEGWKYENCYRTSGSVLAQRFNAQVSYQAASGMGLTQNAMASQEWQLGSLTMPEYINRTLMTDKTPLWPYPEHPAPDLVIVSLGGNDYNHQGDNVPSDAEFNAAYEELLLQLFMYYGVVNEDKTIRQGKIPKIVSICGQGSPNEGTDQNRCRPCPHVEEAVQKFQENNAVDLAIAVDYIFIPCDGSVVTGTNDIGCDGHKNALGQLQVANYLEPRLKDIMNLTNTDSNVLRAPYFDSMEETVHVRAAVRG